MGLTVDSARTVVTGDGVDIDVNEERNTEPSEVTSELVMITEGDGVVTTDIVDDVVVSVEVGEAENDGVDVDVGVNVGVEKVDVVDDEIEREEREEHEDPKRVVNTVTGTLTVNVVGTITVVVLPEYFVKVIKNN